MSDVPSADMDRIRRLPNGISIVSTQDGDMLVNSPPETLKYLLSAGVKPPRLILLPPDIIPGQQLGSSGFVRHGLNYASVEFLIYANFFGGGGKRTHLITVTADQARRLRVILEETISGPGDPAEYAAFPWLPQECAVISHYPPLGRAPRVDDMALITSLEDVNGRVGSLRIRLEDDRFIITENDIDVAVVPTRLNETPVPLTLSPPRPVLRQELTLQFVGGSDGFDPAGITTCFLAYFGDSAETGPTLFDAAAYLRLRLNNLGVSLNQVSEVVLSHVHEDHLAGLPELMLKSEQRVHLITSTLIYRSVLRIFSAMLALTDHEVAALFDFSPLDPGQSLRVGERLFEALYAVHSIPTLTVRVNDLCYSGDMRYDEAWFAELEARGILRPERRADLLRFAEGATILVQDVGGGAIHSTLTTSLLEALARQSQHIVLAHTSKHVLPESRPELEERVEFAGSGLVVGIGDVVPITADDARLETLSASPLYARLPLVERAALAKRATLAAWMDGQAIVREGEPSDGSAYVLHSGLVDIWEHGRRIQVLGRGSSLGERGALDDAPRTTTIVARGTVQLLAFATEIFDEVAEQLGLTEAFTRTEWLWQNHRAFAHLPWATLLDLALDFTPRTLQPGDQLFAPGDAGLEGYMLLSGSLRTLDSEGQRLADVREPGEFLGARAALSRRAHDRAAVATQISEVWALPASALQRLNLVYPSIVLHLSGLGASGTR